MADVRENIVTFKVYGKEESVDLYDIDGVEWRDAKRATGMQRVELVRAAIEAQEFDALAALLWIVRRRDDPDLAYIDVLRSLSLRAGLPVNGEEASPSTSD